MHAAAHRQNGAAMIARAKPNRETFILRWIASRGSYRGDGLSGPDYRAARKLVALCPDLELVQDDSVVGDRTIPGWRLQRRAAP
jgi:hypothetical protein